MLLRSIATLVALALAVPLGAAAPPAEELAARLREREAELAVLARRSDAATRLFMAAEAEASMASAEAGGVYPATRAAAAARGRRDTLAAWIAAAPGIRSRSGAEAWLAGRATELDRAARSLALSEANLKAGVAARSLGPFNVVVALDRLYWAAGYSEGAGRELAEIARDAAAAPPAIDAAARALRRTEDGLLSWSRSCTQTATETICPAP